MGIFSRFESFIWPFSIGNTHQGLLVSTASGYLSILNLSRRDQQYDGLPMFPHLKIRVGPLHGIWHLPALTTLIKFFIPGRKGDEKSEQQQPPQQPPAADTELVEAVRNIWLYGSKMVMGKHIYFSLLF